MQWSSSRAHGTIRYDRRSAGRNSPNERCVEARGRRSAASRNAAYQQAARVQRELADDLFLLKSRVVRPRDQEVLSRAPQAINHRVPHVLRRVRNESTSAIRALPNAPFIVVSTVHTVGATGQSAQSM